MQRVNKRPTNLREFNKQFPPRVDGHEPTATIEDLQRTLSSISDAALGKDSRRLLKLARDLPLTLKNEPGLIDMCARRCLQAASHASLATQEDVWMILRNALRSLPQPTAVALRNVMWELRHHQPATVV